MTGFLKKNLSLWQIQVFVNVSCLSVAPLFLFKKKKKKKKNRTDWKLMNNCWYYQKLNHLPSFQQLSSIIPAIIFPEIIFNHSITATLAASAVLAVIINSFNGFIHMSRCRLWRFSFPFFKNFRVSTLFTTILLSLVKTMSGDLRCYPLTSKKVDKNLNDP